MRSLASEHLWLACNLGSRRTRRAKHAALLAYLSAPS